MEQRGQSLSADVTRQRAYALPAGFYVFTGPAWLADDEQSLTLDVSESAVFTSAELARQIAERQGLGMATIMQADPQPSAREARLAAALRPLLVHARQACQSPAVLDVAIANAEAALADAPVAGEPVAHRGGDLSGDLHALAHFTDDNAAADTMRGVRAALEIARDYSNREAGYALTRMDRAINADAKEANRERARQLNAITDAAGDALAMLEGRT